MTLDAAVRHSIKQGTLYRLLCHLVVNFRDILERSFRGSLEHGLMSETKRKHEFCLKMTLMEEVSTILFIPGLIVSTLLESALDDVGFSIVFQRRLIFTYPEGADLVWMGYRIDGEYVVRGRPTSRAAGWLSESSSNSEMELELEAPSLDVPLES